MTAIETSATPMTSMAGAAADDAAAGPVIRSAWLAPGFYLAFLFGALFLFAIGLLLLWRSAKKLRRFRAPAGNGFGSAWSGRHPSPTT